MLGQTFHPRDLLGVAALVALEALLSGDNALVLAILVRHLPADQQKKALYFGLTGAIVFRLLAIVFAAVVLKQWWLQGLGAIYLLAAPIKHFISSGRRKKRTPERGGASFWMAVLAVEVTDMAFAVDSVLAGVTFVDNKYDKLWIVYFGAVIGIVLIRFAAGAFIRLLERYPDLDHVAYLLVGWVGIKLAFLTVRAFEATHPRSLSFDFPDLPTVAFWTVLALIAVLGSWNAVRRKAD